MEQVLHPVGGQYGSLLEVRNLLSVTLGQTSAPMGLITSMPPLFWHKSAESKGEGRKWTGDRNWHTLVLPPLLFAFCLWSAPSLPRNSPIPPPVPFHPLPPLPDPSTGLLFLPKVTGSVCGPAAQASFALPRAS